MSGMDRHPTTQDLSWFLDQDRNKKLDLAPNYQRRSVWTRKDRQFFLDTIFRGFPSPAIYLHKTITDQGDSVYHVVDGKQRLETVLMFVNDEVRISSEYGDTRLNGMKFSQLDADMKKLLWNYSVPVEVLDFDNDAIVNEVFDRLNRNARKLSRQELRHARFDGWFIGMVESEIAKPEWKEIELVTTAREKRMSASQTLSELFLVILEQEILGFDQDALDRFYVKYDDLEGTPDYDGEAWKVSPDEFVLMLEGAKKFVSAMERTNQVVSTYASTVTNLYTLWSVIVLGKERLSTPEGVARGYKSFMEKVTRVAEVARTDPLLSTLTAPEFEAAKAYWQNAREASTDKGPRLARHETLIRVLST